MFYPHCVTITGTDSGEDFPDADPLEDAFDGDE